MKPLVVFLPPLDGMLVHRTLAPKHLARWYSFIHVGGERHFEKIVRTQQTVPGQGSNVNRSRSERTNHEATSVSQV